VPLLTCVMIDTRAMHDDAEFQQRYFANDGAYHCPCSKRVVIWAAFINHFKACKKRKQQDCEDESSSVDGPYACAVCTSASAGQIQQFEFRTQNAYIKHMSTQQHRAAFANQQTRGFLFSLLLISLFKFTLCRTICF
jgi:hypothetical protein